MVVHGWAKYATVDWKKVVGRWVKRVPIRELRPLLWYESMADGNTQKRFESWARGENRDIRFEVDTRIVKEMKGGFVPDYNRLNLYVVQREAKSKEEKDPSTAEIIYMGLSESLAIHIQSIDDSSGTFWPMFEECIEAIGNCIRRQELSAEDKRWRIEYLAGWSAVAFSDFVVYYEKLLTELCTDAGDLDVWKKALEDELHNDDAEERDCNWAVSKEGIRNMLERVQKLKDEMSDSESGGTG